MLEKIIRETIAAAGASQAGVSQALGKGRRYISVLLASLKTSHKSVALSTLIAVCKVCGARVVLVDKAGRVTDLTDAL